MFDNFNRQDQFELSMIEYVMTLHRVKLTNGHPGVIQDAGQNAGPGPKVQNFR